MLQEKLIVVIIPAYNEDYNISKVIETMPEFVDRILIINDGSQDETSNQVKKYFNTKYNISLQSILFPMTIGPHKIEASDYEYSRIIIVHHNKNLGKGAGIKTGYQICQQLTVHCIATMDGDGQMDPEDLINICNPIVENKAQYTKGNRLTFNQVKKIMPSSRYFGNLILTFFTRISSGYWNILDTQTGYTCISLSQLKRINIDHLYPLYGYPNEMLAILNAQNTLLKEVNVRPIYESHHKSKMHLPKVIPRITILLLKSYFQRIFNKYLIQKKHPIFLLILIAIISFPFFPKTAISLYLIGTIWDIQLGQKLIIK
jgi:glycosyltransferase involved in cell wall biosynthesis